MKKGINLKKKMEKLKGIRFFNFSAKLVALCVIPMLFVCIIITAKSTGTIKTILNQETENSLKIVAVSVSEAYENLYQGDYTRDKGGVVRKGDVKISKNNDLIDAIKEETGYEVSLTYGDMRLVTTLTKENGTRKNGISMDKEFFERIDTGEASYITGYEMEGNIYDLYYYPLKNSDGSTVGYIEVANIAASERGIVEKETRVILSYAVFFLLLASVLSLLISSRMSAAMKASKEYLAAIVDGDLGREYQDKYIKRDDELGDIYRTGVTLQENLRKIVNDIKNSSDNLKESAEGLILVAGNTSTNVDSVIGHVETINQGAGTQLEQSQEASDNVDIIHREIGSVSDAVGDMAEYAKQMSDAENASVEIIEELHEYSAATRKSLSRAVSEMGLMNDSVKGINEAVTLIQNIADETDLLSLNASIEAARAGDAGRGFAVVAEQISKLASESGNSAGRIEGMIENLLEITDKVVALMEQVNQDMNNQENKLNQTMEKYKAVDEAINRSLQNISDIESKMSSLSSSSERIEGIVGSLSQVSENNASSAQNTMDDARNMTHAMEELKCASADLQSLSDKLSDMLVIFKL